MVSYTGGVFSGFHPVSSRLQHRGLVRWFMFYVCAEHTLEWEFLSETAGTIIPLAALPFGLNEESLITVLMLYI